MIEIVKEIKNKTRLPSLRKFDRNFPKFIIPITFGIQRYTKFHIIMTTSDIKVCAFPISRLSLRMRLIIILFTQA